MTSASVTYTHAPYGNLSFPFEIIDGDEALLAPSLYPEGTLHAVNLIGKVEFLPFPKAFKPNAVIESPVGEASMLERLFIGQLPYNVSDEEVQWICETLCRATVHRPERIIKKMREGGAREPTGCLHIHVHPQHAQRMMATMNKRVLVDKTGVWVARTDGQKATLDAYVKYMKQIIKVEATSRPIGMPYDTINIEAATSDFRARHPPREKGTGRRSPRPADAAFAAAAAVQPGFPYEAAASYPFDAAVEAVAFPGAASFAPAYYW
jgi:hypothetical protein